MKLSSVWGFLPSLLTPLVATKLQSWWIPPGSGRRFWERCSDLCNLRLIFNSPRSQVHTSSPLLRECVACVRHGGDIAAVREQLSVFLQVCEERPGAWPPVMFSRRAWIAAELSSQGCSVFYRLYLRCFKKVSSEHHFKKQLWPCGPEVLVNCVVSPSVGYLAPHPMWWMWSSCFLLSLSSSETFPLHLASPVMHLPTPSIQMPLHEALLQGAVFSLVWFILIMLQEIWGEIVACSSASSKHCLH